jgi:hypothetical protein
VVGDDAKLIVVFAIRLLEKRFNRLPDDKVLLVGRINHEESAVGRLDRSWLLLLGKHGYNGKKHDIAC